MESPDGSLSFYVVLLIVLILVNGFFSMSEIAIISLNDNKIRKMAQEGHLKAKILVKMINEPSKFLATIQVGVTLSGYMASAVAADTFATRIVYAMQGVPVSSAVVRVVSLVVITLVLSYITLVFGELVPKRIGMQHHEKIALFVARPLSFLSVVEKPLVFLASTSTNGVLRLLGINPNQQPEQVTEEEIRMMIDVGNESGNIEADEKDMLNNIFEFDDRTATEMMTHRTEIMAVELGSPLDEIVKTALESGHSRIPVFEDDLDTIVGILYVKDLLKRLTGSSRLPFDLNDYLHEPLYVPETTTGHTLLEEFRQRKLHMAIVVDEYGGTSGLVTMEDLMEAIVGNIQDEYDDEEDDITSIGEDLYEINGQADLEEVAKFFSLELDGGEDEDFETIGGYIIHRLGHIPAEGETPSVTLADVHFKVAAMDERRIHKLHAHIITKEKQSGEASGKE